MAKAYTFIIYAFVLALCPARGVAQAFAGCDVMPASSLVNEAGDRFGSGSMTVWEGGVAVPLAMKKSADGRPVVWRASLGAAYAELQNHGEAARLNPDNIVNANISLMHLRPMGRRWSVMGVLGGGVYSAARNVSAKSILANGGVVFVYKLNRNADIGVGAGVTNSYGVPIAMPMFYFNWHKQGRYDFKVDMATGLSVSASTQVSKCLRLELVALEMKGMSAVTDVDGKSKIYSSAMLKSYICPSLSLGKHASLYIGAGAVWMRGISMNNRSIKAFFKTFSDDRDEPYFHPVPTVTAGVRCRF